MPLIIKDGQVVEDDWHLVEDAGLFPEGKIIISMSSWNEQQVQFSKRFGKVGVWMDSDESPEDIDNLHKVVLVAIRFDNFMDGRGFSIARLLRERYQYEGEIRAIGAPIRDQLSYLQRCGFNAFQLADHYDPEEALASLKDFTENYQADTHQETPLFRRRN